MTSGPVRLTGPQLAQAAVSAVQALRDHGTKADRAQVYPVLYRADPRLQPLIDWMRTYHQTPSKQRSKAYREEAGRKLERIATIAFQSLIGCDSVKSFTSVGAQYDVIVRGAAAEWRVLREALGLRGARRSIVIEAKATAGNVSDATFARLCSLLAFNLRTTAALGVFFTLEGAAGFPKPGKPPKRKLGQARLRQVMFYSITSKPIVVFEWTDIEMLTQPGGLTRLLDDKLVDLEELSGLTLGRVNGNEVALPTHLADLAPP